jgi:protein involved in polysaccharide export with SLBB domain
MNFKKIIFGLIAFTLTLHSVSAQIQAGKSINITIAGVPEQDKVTITNVYPVSGAGMINMPYLGEVRAAGLKTEDLQTSLQRAYVRAGIYTNPTIQVIANINGAAVNQETVMVGGQVRRPGPVPFAKESSLWGAIQAAGGPTEFGSMRRVKLTRNGNMKVYDVTKPKFMQIPLERNDTIDIPQKTPFGG